MRGAVRYEFELATKSKFAESSIVWRSDSLKTPTTAIPVALPWMTGSPLRPLGPRPRLQTQGRDALERPVRLRHALDRSPRTQPSPPGLVRWSTVEGATGYQVWFLGPRKRIATKTNVADEREHWTFHQDPSWTAAVPWRVRAVRSELGATLNGMPAVSYRPWSQTFVELNPPMSATTLTLSTMASAWAPRTTGPLALPGTQEELDKIRGAPPSVGKYVVEHRRPAFAKPHRALCVRSR